MKEFITTVEDIFYVSVKFEHNFKFHTNKSKTSKQISADIYDEIRARTNRALKFIDFMNSFLSFFFIFVFIS